MVDDPRKPSLLDRLWRRRPPEPAPQPAAPVEPAEPERRKQRQPTRSNAPTRARAPSRAGDRAAPARPAASPRQEFGERSGSDRIKRDQAFEARFKTEATRAEALQAIDDAAKLKTALQEQHIARMREWKEDLRFLTSSRLPVPEEAGGDINRRHQALFERFDRQMREVDEALEQALTHAAGRDLTIDLKRQKLLGYTPNRPRDFRQAARPPEPAGPVPGDPPGQGSPGRSRPELGDAFNDAVTRPAPARRTAEPAFNDAATAPDPLAAYFEQFRQAAPPPDPARRPIEPAC